MLIEYMQVIGGVVDCHSVCLYVSIYVCDVEDAVNYRLVFIIVPFVILICLHILILKVLN